MPPIPTRTLKPHPLPAGGTWFLSRDEAAAHPGVHIELVTCVAHFHGVYPDVESLVHHGRTFLNRHPAAETYAQVEEICQAHFEFPVGLRKRLGIPLGGRWFMHEGGARAAAHSAPPDHHIASMLLRSDDDSDNLTIWGCYPSSDAFHTDLAKCCAALPKGQCIAVHSDKGSLYAHGGDDTCRLDLSRI
jgi:hypothetical protein